MRGVSLTTRIAPEVPTITAIRSGVAQPLPRLLQAPSPTGGVHEASRSAGQRRVYESRSPEGVLHVAQRRQLLAGDPDGLQDFRIPIARVDVQQAGARGHRDRAEGPAEEP